MNFTLNSISNAALLHYEELFDSRVTIHTNRNPFMKYLSTENGLV